MFKFKDDFSMNIISKGKKCESILIKFKFFFVSFLIAIKETSIQQRLFKRLNNFLA